MKEGVRMVRLKRALFMVAASFAVAKSLDILVVSSTFCMTPGDTFEIAVN